MWFICQMFPKLCYYMTIKWFICQVFPKLYHYMAVSWFICQESCKLCHYMAVSWFVYPVFHRLQDNAALTSLVPTRVSGVMVKVTGFGLAFSSSACDLYSMMNSHCFWRSLLSSDRFISTRIIYWNHTHHHGSVLTCTEITHITMVQFSHVLKSHITIVQFSHVLKSHTSQWFNSHMYWNHTHHHGSVLTCTEITHHNGSILTCTEITHITMVQFSHVLKSHTSQWFNSHMYWNHTHHHGSIITCTEITHHNGSILTCTEITHITIVQFSQALKSHITMVQFLLYMYINSGVTPWQPLSPFVTFPTLNPFSPEAYYMLFKCSFLSRTDLKWGQTDHKCSLWECCSKCGCTNNFESLMTSHKVSRSKEST